MLNINVIMKKEDNTEQAILQAAEKEFFDKGFALAKTTDIAQAAGVTHAMLHYYYRTKEKLFERIFQEKVQVMSRSLCATFEDGKPFLRQLEDLIGTHFDFIAANPRLPLFLLNEIHLNEERRRMYLPILLEAVAETRQKLSYEMERALKRGEIRAMGTADLLFSIVSLNIMSFVGLPVAREAFGMSEEDVRLFVARRREENVEMILSRLRK